MYDLVTYNSRSQRRPATLSPKGSASTSPSWCPCSSLLRSVLTSPRRSAPGLAPTQGRSRSLLSRSGAMYQLPSLAWPNEPLCNSAQLKTKENAKSNLTSQHQSRQSFERHKTLRISFHRNIRLLFTIKPSQDEPYTDTADHKAISPNKYYGCGH